MLYRLSAMDGGSPSAILVHSSCCGLCKATMEAKATPSDRPRRSCTGGNTGSEEGGSQSDDYYAVKGDD